MTSPRALLLVLVALLALSGCASEVLPLPSTDVDDDGDDGRDGGDARDGSDTAPDLSSGDASDTQPDTSTNTADVDGDGHPAASDCNDFDASVHPGALEVCDGYDNDCDDRADEDFDADGDAYPTCVTFRAADCNDGDPAIHPAAIEVCDGIDNNCDGASDEGSDADGDGAPACSPDPALADCDDTDGARFPGAVERCDASDNDCDGEVDEGSACVGCSDGARDELADLARWPSVAACKGQYGRGSLRRARTGTACGDDLGVPCPAPEDLCAPGWHLCMRNGQSADLRFRMTPQDCNALPEVYVAATNNCSNDPAVSPAQTGCDTTEPYGCYETGWCSAPVACGQTETSHCAHAAWPNATRIFGQHAGRTENAGCGNFGSDVAYSGQGALAGVLCCLD